MPELVAAAIVLLFAGSLVVVALRRRAPPWRRVALGLGSLAAVSTALLVAAAATNRQPSIPEPPPDLPLAKPADGDIGSTACRACHPRQHATWHTSYHRTMTQTASAASVLGDFDDHSVEFGGRRYRLFERDGRFYGEMPGAARPLALTQTTGSHHMQIYWYAPGDDRRLEAFPLVYWREQQRWIPRLAAFLTPPNAGPAPASVWNTTCIGCHTTRPRPRLSGGGSGRVDSQITELGIACESCHGPGAEHAARHRSPIERYRHVVTDEPDPTIVDPRNLSHVRASQVCGQCHAVKAFHSAADSVAWGERGYDFVAGDDLDAHVGILSNASFDEPWARKIRAEYPDFIRGSFWDDGVVRVTGREYNALLEAPCFERGEMSCLSCHTLHQTREDPRDAREWANDQLAPGMDTNLACLGCHERFESTAALSAHSNHPPDSSGSECQNCHMPHTNYGLLKAVRAHDIGNPSAATSGPGSERPNACNLCHLDRTLGWTAEHLERWYGQPSPPLDADDRTVSAAVRWALEGDAGVRALVAWSMGWAPAQQASGTDWVVPYLAQLMEDPYDAVRIIAARSLRTLPEFEDAAFDALAEPPQRSATVHALRERWASGAYGLAAIRDDARAVRNGATLVAPDRSLDHETFARLLAARDDRPLNLAE